MMSHFNIATEQITSAELFEKKKHPEAGLAR